MSANDFQKYDPIWSYFQINGYDSSLLKDFGVVDEETHDLFVQLLCKNRKISPPLKMAKMKIGEFESKSYQLLRQDDLFALLKKMAFPLRIRRWELYGEEASNSSVSLHQTADILQSEEFKSDDLLRWQTYFDFVIDSIWDLKTPYIDQLKKTYPCFEKFEEENFQKASRLESGLRGVIAGIGEHIYQKETIWYAKDEPLSSIYSRFSRVFDASKGILTQEELQQRELNALDLFGRAVVWTDTNEKKSQLSVFDAIYDIREMILAHEIKPNLISYKKIQQNIANKNKERGSNERD